MSSPTHDHARIVVHPPLIYLAGLLAGVLLQRLLPALPLFWARDLGVVLAVFAVVVGVAGQQALRRAGTPMMPWRSTTALVTGGPYRFSRNPLYVGLALFYLAVSCWLGLLWPILLLPLVLVAMHWGVIVREERYLEEKFGEEYRVYRAQVRRWL